MFITVQYNNQVKDYSELGYDKKLNKIPDDISTGTTRRKNYITSLEADSMLEGVDASKLLSNALKSVIDLGSVVINGKEGRIEVKDGNKIIGVIGKF